MLMEGSHRKGTDLRVFGMIFVLSLTFIACVHYALAQYSEALY